MRARYAPFGPHRTATRCRHIDHWRPVLAWAEAEVWGLVGRYAVTPHPAYSLGWSRVSCRSCIFGSPNQWATLRAVFPETFARIAAREAATGLTIQRRASTVELADHGRPTRRPCRILSLSPRQPPGPRPRRSSAARGGCRQGLSARLRAPLEPMTAGSAPSRGSPTSSSPCLAAALDRGAPLFSWRDPPRPGATPRRAEGPGRDAAASRAADALSSLAAAAALDGASRGEGRGLNALQDPGSSDGPA